MLYNYLVTIILNSIFAYLFFLQYFDHPPSYKLNSVYPPKIISKLKSPCPKIIYQIVPDINDIPAGLYHTIMNNITMNPEFEYKIYDYNTALELLKKDFDSEVVTAYNSTNANQLKTDYLKYVFIHKYGGIFLDIKYICKYRFIDLLEYNNVFFVQKRRMDDIELALLVSHPNNYAINKAFETATYNLRFKNYLDSAKKITGGMVLRDELAKINYKIEDTDMFIEPSHIVRLKHNFNIILTKYKSFDKENELYSLLPCVLNDYRNNLLFNETESLIKNNFIIKKN
jgi:mannosyltransferase OCH1-like enzyme